MGNTLTITDVITGGSYTSPDLSNEPQLGSLTSGRQIRGATDRRMLFKQRNAPLEVTFRWEVVPFSWIQTLIALDKTRVFSLSWTTSDKTIQTVNSASLWPVSSSRDSNTSRSVTLIAKVVQTTGALSLISSLTTTSGLQYLAHDPVNDRIFVASNNLGNAANFRGVVAINAATRSVISSVAANASGGGSPCGWWDIFYNPYDLRCYASNGSGALSSYTQNRIDCLSLTVDSGKGYGGGLGCGGGIYAPTVYYNASPNNLDPSNLWWYNTTTGNPFSTASMVAALSFNYGGGLGGFQQFEKGCLNATQDRVFFTNPTGDRLLTKVLTGSTAPIITYTGTTNPWGICLDPVEGFLWITEKSQNVVRKWDPNTNASVLTIATPNAPYGIAASPTLGRLYITCNGSNQMIVIDTATNEILQTVNVGSDPRGVIVVNGLVWVAHHSGLVQVWQEL